MKLDKAIVQRRLDLMAAEGVVSLHKLCFFLRDMLIIHSRHLSPTQMLESTSMFLSFVLRMMPS